MVPKAADLKKRVQEIDAGDFDADLVKYEKMGEKELRDLYKKRDIEPA
jgi:hypothetical protein